MDPSDILFGNTNARAAKIAETDEIEVPDFVNLGPHYFEHVLGFSGTNSWMIKDKALDEQKLPSDWTETSIFASLNQAADNEKIKRAKAVKKKHLKGLCRCDFSEKTTQIFGKAYNQVSPSKGQPAFENERQVFISRDHIDTIESLVAEPIWYFEPDLKSMLAVDSDNSEVVAVAEALVDKKTKSKKLLPAEL